MFQSYSYNECAPVFNSRAESVSRKRVLYDRVESVTHQHQSYSLTIAYFECIYSLTPHMTLTSFYNALIIARSLTLTPGQLKIYLSNLVDVRLEPLGDFVPILFLIRSLTHALFFVPRPRRIEVCTGQHPSLSPRLVRLASASVCLRAWADQLVIIHKEFC